MTNAVLKACDLSAGYGAIVALRGITFEVRQAQTVAIIGANGAGKSTLMRALSGMIEIRSGEATFEGARIAGLRPHSLVRMGMLHIPEGRGTLSTLTVEANMRLAFEMRPSKDVFEDAVERVFVRFPRLRERLHQLAGNLSGGEQQMLALSRAILAPPHLLLVDEPSLGLAPLMVNEMFKVLGEFKAAGMSMLIVEQNVRKALGLADYGFVLRNGVLVASGAASDLLNDPSTFDKYLGPN